MVKTVVIVDDDADLLHLLSLGFESKGYKIVSFTTGGEAIKAFADKTLATESSLLVLDRLLPDMDGLDVLKDLNKNYEKHMPVLILSVLSAEKDVLSGLEKGAVDYIAKPFSLPILLQKAEALIKG